MVLIQLIFYSLSVVLVCLQNQVYGDATKQFFFKSKAIIYRNIFSCYQLIASISDIFVAEGFKLKANKGNSNVRYFLFSTREHSSAEKLECLL